MQTQRSIADGPDSALGTRTHELNTDDEVSPEFLARTRSRHIMGATEFMANEPKSEEPQRFQPPFLHLNFLDVVLDTDHDYIIKRDQEYNASWLARGGVGAFMMLARKWDRMEPMVAKYGYDIFAMLEAHPDRIDDVEDLCRYLTLVRSEWARRLSLKK